MSTAVALKHNISAIAKLSPAEFMYRLWALGWTVIPVRPGSKAPLSIKWPELAEERSLDLLPSIRDTDNYNIALYLGTMVDLDVEFDITPILPKLFEQAEWLSRCPIVKTPKGVAILLSCPEFAGRQAQVKDEAGNLLLEVRSGRRYRIISGYASGTRYSFLVNNIVYYGITPADLPSVSIESLQRLVKLVLSVSSRAYNVVDVDAICPPASQPDKLRCTPACSSSATTFQQFKDSILWDADLFNLVFERYGHTLPGRATAFLCPFHSESNPSAAWDLDRNSGKVIFIDYHRRGEDGRLVYDLVDCYAALKTGELRHVPDPQEYMSFLYDLAEEFDILPEYVRITEGILDRYATYIKQLKLKSKDQQVMEQVWSLLSRRCLIQKLYGSDIFGDSVRWIASHTGIDTAAVNRAINLLCTLGFIEKTDMHSSMASRRPDRFRLVIDTVYTQVKNTYNRLKEAGAATLRKLNQNIVQAVIGTARTVNIFRRQSDEWERIDRQPAWLPVSAGGVKAKPHPQPPQGTAVSMLLPIYTPYGVMLLQ